MWACPGILQNGHADRLSGCLSFSSSHSDLILTSSVVLVDWQCSVARPGFPEPTKHVSSLLSHQWWQISSSGKGISSLKLDTDLTQGTF